jgi:hypothetical protein
MHGAEQAVKPFGEQPLGRACLSRHGHPSPSRGPVVTLAGCRIVLTNASY